MTSEVQDYFEEQARLEEKKRHSLRVFPIVIPPESGGEQTYTSFSEVKYYGYCIGGDWEQEDSTPNYIVNSFRSHYAGI